MIHLNSEHIDFIVKDLNYRGIVLEGFQDEIIDHFCTAVEAEMEGKAIPGCLPRRTQILRQHVGLRKTQQLHYLKIKKQPLC